MPLCPNCHLVDQHDASNAMPQPKLHLFRRYKHRHILKPQFNPILRRLVFLGAIKDSDDADSLQEKSTELIELVRNLAMGQFYAESLKKLLNRPIYPYAWTGDPTSDLRMAARMEKEALEYRDQLRRVNTEVEALIVEMLDYQTWTSADAWLKQESWTRGEYVMNAEASVFLVPLQKLLEYFQRDRHVRDEKKDAALLAINSALVATEKYIEIGCGRDSSVREKEYHLAELWGEAAVRIRHASPEMALRLRDKADYWLDRFEWSREEVLLKRIDLDSVRHTAREVLAP